MHKIKIEAVLNGFIVNVGCQTLVYDDPNKLIADLAAYFQKPYETEKRILSSACHANLKIQPQRAEHGPIGLDGIRGECGAQCPQPIETGLNRAYENQALGVPTR